MLPWQVPLFFEQSAQIAPPVPQAMSVLPGRHWSFWQHPWPQVAGPHPEEPTHWPLLQVSPGPHTTQGKPALPHAALVDGLTQALP